MSARCSLAAGERVGTCLFAIRSCRSWLDEVYRPYCRVDRLANSQGGPSGRFRDSERRVIREWGAEGFCGAGDLSAPKVHWTRRPKWAWLLFELRVVVRKFFQFKTHRSATCDAAIARINHAHGRVLTGSTGHQKRRRLLA